MINASSNKPLLWLIGLLLFTNIAMLVFFLFFNEPQKKSKPREDYIESFLKKDLKFDTTQMNTYNGIKSKHMEMVRPLFDSLKNAKDTYYQLLYSQQSGDSLVSQKASVIGHDQTQLELSMFQHLKNVRALCTPGQLVIFDSSFKKVIEKFTGHGRKPKEDKNKFKAKD